MKFSTTKGDCALAFDPSSFQRSHERFLKLVEIYSGHPFAGFHEGLLAVWENYKPKLRDMALSNLDTTSWQQESIGRGEILERAISAIEIQDNRPGGLTNNLVYWQNRYGHMSREHRTLLDAQQDVGLRRNIEAALFALYRSEADDGELFDRLSSVTGRKYTLSAYFYFLKDMNRFMPIQPTGFDRVFAALGLNFTTLRKCDWENYAQFNDILQDVRSGLEQFGGLKHVRLVDAHSYCWAFATLLKRVPEGTETPLRPKRDDGRILGALERSIATMRFNILHTVAQARGQVVNRNVQMKVKDLGFESEQALDAYLKRRMEIQGGRCALTGIPLHLHGAEGTDHYLHPSADRIDSDGHYSPGNIQVVCQFANMWKRNMENAEFLRLLELVRGQEGDAIDGAIN